MKKLFFITLASFAFFISLFYANFSDENTKSIHFAVAAEYPPFEYNDHGKIKGFDIDLARLIANKLGKEAFFDTMQFSSILPALSLVRAALPDAVLRQCDHARSSIRLRACCG